MNLSQKKASEKLSCTTIVGHMQKNKCYWNCLSHYYNSLDNICIFKTPLTKYKSFLHMILQFLALSLFATGIQKSSCQHNDDPHILHFFCIPIITVREYFMKTYNYLTRQAHFKPNLLDVISLKLLGGQFPPELVFFVMRRELLNFSEMVPWSLSASFHFGPGCCFTKAFRRQIGS